MSHCRKMAIFQWFDRGLWLSRVRTRSTHPHARPPPPPAVLPDLCVAVWHQTLASGRSNSGRSKLGSPWLTVAEGERVIARIPEISWPRKGPTAHSVGGIEQISTNTRPGLPGNEATRVVCAVCVNSALPSSADALDLAWATARVEE